MVRRRSESGLLDPTALDLLGGWVIDLEDLDPLAKGRSPERERIHACAQDDELTCPGFYRRLETLVDVAGACQVLGEDRAPPPVKDEKG